MNAWLVLGTDNDTATTTRRWRTLRAGVERYVNRYHHRPHQFLGYRTPKEVRKTWEDAQEVERL